MKENNTLTSNQYKTYFDKAISYDKYLENFEEEMNPGTSPFAQYLPQNWSRQARLYRKLQLNEELLIAIKSLEKPINWMVITEHWCGDASQINPVFQKVAEASSGLINLKFIYRDENEELIHAHLTDGRSKSIPILIQLDKDYSLISTYGPRPAEAQVLVKSLLAKDEAYNIPLHSWYAKDKQVSIQNDLVHLISQIGKL